MSAIKWTKDSPRRPAGTGIEARVLVVLEVKSGYFQGVHFRGANGLGCGVYAMDYFDDLTVENFPGEWAGPIEPPT